MLQNNLKTIGFMVLLSICLLSTMSNADGNGVLDLANTADEDFSDFYLDNQDVDTSEDSEELIKRGLPKLRRIFIGKRAMNDVDEYLAKRSNLRRHIFIGKRNENRYKKHGRIHRIFIG